MGFGGLQPQWKTSNYLRPFQLWFSITLQAFLTSTLGGLYQTSVICTHGCYLMPLEGRPVLVTNAHGTPNKQA